MHEYTFKVVGVKKKRWWSLFSGAKLVTMQIVHDDPHDWPLQGLLKLDIKDPREADKFEKGQLYTVTVKQEKP